MFCQALPLIEHISNLSSAPEFHRIHYASIKHPCSLVHQDIQCSAQHADDWIEVGFSSYLIFRSSNSMRKMQLSDEEEEPRSAYGTSRLPNKHRWSTTSINCCDRRWMHEWAASNVAPKLDRLLCTYTASCVAWTAEAFAQRGISQCGDAGYL